MHRVATPTVLYCGIARVELPLDELMYSVCIIIIIIILSYTTYYYYVYIINTNTREASMHTSRTYILY